MNTFQFSAMTNNSRHNAHQSILCPDEQQAPERQQHGAGHGQFVLGELRALAIGEICLREAQLIHVHLLDEMKIY